MLDPIRFGVADPWASKVLDGAPTAGGRDEAVSDRDGGGRGVVCRSDMA